MKILITGHRGYIGPHLVRLFQEKGHRVTGADIGYFDTGNCNPVPSDGKDISTDFRSLPERDLESFVGDRFVRLRTLKKKPAAK